MKKILLFLLTLSILLSFPLAAQAHDVPQDREDCSIEVIVRYEGENLDDGTLTLVRIAHVEEEDGNFYFVQEITGERLEDVSSAEARAAIIDFYNENKTRHDFDTKIEKVEEGRALFTDLPIGLYLIVQESAAYGYSYLEPFLVSVPYMLDGQYQYHVTAAAKSSLEKEPEPTEPPPPTVPDGPNLPQTGQLNWPIPLMAVAGFGLFVVGWVLLFGKKREKYEK